MAGRPCEMPCVPAYSTRQSPGAAPSLARTAVGSGRGIEPPERDAVADRVHLARRHAAADQVVPEPLADHDHLVGGRVGGEFQAFEQADDPAVGQHAELGEDGRPQVADLHDQPGPLHPGQQPRRADGEEGRRGDHDDVGPPVTAAPSSTLLTMKLRWPRVLRTMPSFGVAYSQVRSTR